MAPRWKTILGALAAVASLGAAPAAHPIHSSLAVVTHVPAERAVTVNVRVFADDFAAAIARQGPARPGTPADPTQRYVASAFALWNADGTRVPLRWCGARPQGDVVYVCLRGPLTGALRGGRVLSTFHFGLFNDQVNVVQVTDARGKKTMMFVPGDRAKVIR